MSTVPTPNSLKPGALGVSVYPERHRLKVPCVNCPFKAEAEGEPFLSEQRMEDIKFAVCLGQPFWCHKTVYSAKTERTIDLETGEEDTVFGRHWRMCEGAARWAEKLKDKLGL